MKGIIIASKQKRQNNKLPPLQRRIILYLAQHLPQTKSEVVRGIESPEYKSSYKSSWFALKSLMEKGIVREMGLVTARRTRYPTYWLTEDGTYRALREGASWKSLLERTRETYPKNEHLQCLIETSPYTGTDAYEMAHQKLANKRKLEPSDYDEIMSIQILKGLTPEQFNGLFAVLRKGYPKIYRQVEENLEQLAKYLQQVLKAIRGESKL
jgi:hypothetical protein